MSWSVITSRIALSIVLAVEAGVREAISAPSSKNNNVKALEIEVGRVGPRASADDPSSTNPNPKLYAFMCQLGNEALPNVCYPLALLLIIINP